MTELCDQSERTAASDTTKQIADFNQNNDLSLIADRWVSQEQLSGRVSV